MTDLEVSEPKDPEARIFLSYSRKDREIAQRVSETLRSRGFEVFRDTDDILPTEEWRERLSELITQADTIVFLLSPHSSKSEVCAWEVELASSLNKRIAPIVIDEVEDLQIPPLLARLNFIFCTPRDPFEDAVDTLVSALKTDIGWIREHTRLAGLAKRWRDAGNAPRFLLRGQDISDAEQWRDNHPDEAPPVTRDQAVFIAQSRAAAGRRQTITIAASLAAAAFAVGLSIFAYFQSVEANQQRVLAEENAEEANRQREAVTRRLISQNLRSGDFSDAAKLMIDIDPDSPATRTVLAGLLSPEEAGKRDQPGIPFILNNRLYLSRENAPPIPLDLDITPTGWLPMQDSALLLSDNSAIIRINTNGEVIGRVAQSSDERPCGIHRGTDATNVYSLGQSGLSAGSQYALVTTIAHAGGAFTRAHYYGGQKLQLSGPAGSFEIDAYDLILACRNGVRSSSNGPNPVPSWQDFERQVRRFERISFPGLAAEARLWSGDREPNLTNSGQFSYLDRLGIDENVRREIGPRLRMGQITAVVEHGDAVILLSTSHTSTLRGSYNVCLVDNSVAEYGCKGFTALTNVRTAWNSTKRELAISGYDIIAHGERNNLWIMTATSNRLQAVPMKEAVRSVAYSDDGRLAALEPGALVIFDSDLKEIHRVPVPEGMGSVSWLPDGRILLLGLSGVYAGKNPNELEFTPFSMPRPEREEARPFYLWTETTGEDPIIALGYRSNVVLFDTTYMAPVSRDFKIPHRYSDWDRTLHRFDNGGWRLVVMGTEYVRHGFEGKPEELEFEPEAALR